jgi:hypothetical protein
VTPYHRAAVTVARDDRTHLGLAKATPAGGRSRGAETEEQRLWLSRASAGSTIASRIADGGDASRRYG